MSGGGLFERAASGSGRKDRRATARRCSQPGCKAPAGFGENVFLRGDPAKEKWWCRAHLPADYFAARDREEGR